MKIAKKKIGAVIVLTGGIFSALYFFIPAMFSREYDFDTKSKLNAKVAEADQAIPLVPAFIVTHMPTPEPLKAIYMTACVASVPSWRTKLAHMIDTTELNAVVIDVKDYSGTISYFPTNPKLKEVQGAGCRVRDLKEFVASLHEKGIYVISRITVFQDPAYTKAHPELAVKKADGVTVWKDRKGLSFIDVGAKPYWEYITKLALDTYAQGFDEINFDYIRFPSDGDMQDILYTWTGTTTKSLALENFFMYLQENVKPSGAVISADLFGMTTINTDDLGIGQVLEPALRHFDYVAPMVYPSHYPPQFNGWANPNQHVYDVVHYSMSRAVERAVATTTPVLHLGAQRIGTSTPALYTKTAYSKNKLRPWLQDFDYGGDYGAEEVRAQIQATYDSGLTSWMLWDPGNKYTPEALLRE